MSKTSYKLDEFLAAPNEYNWLYFYPCSGNNNYKFTDNDCQRLMPVLQNNSTVTNLQLYNNQIGDSGAAAIGQGLASNKKLTNLQLYNNQIGDSGAAAIGQGLASNQTLQYLYLYDNQIGDSGAAAIGQGLASNQTLQYLGLHNNQIGDSGINTLKHAGSRLGSNLRLESQKAAPYKSFDQIKVEREDYEMFMTVFSNDIEKIQNWVDINFDFDKKDSNGKTLLLHAAFLGRKDIIDLLIKKGLCLGSFDKKNSEQDVLKLCNFLKNPELKSKIKMAALVDEIYQGKNFCADGVNLSHKKPFSAESREGFLERLKLLLIKNGITSKFKEGDYVKLLKGYLSDSLPDFLDNDILMLVEDLYNIRNATLSEIQEAIVNELKTEFMGFIPMLSAREELLYLMVHFEAIPKLLSKMHEIILTQNEKQLLDVVEYRYNNLGATPKALIKKNIPNIEKALEMFKAKVAIISLDWGLVTSNVFDEGKVILDKVGCFNVEKMKIALKRILLIDEIFPINFDTSKDVDSEIGAVVEHVLSSHRSVIPMITQSRWVGVVIEKNEDSIGIVYSDPSGRSWSDSNRVSGFVVKVISAASAFYTKDYKYYQEDYSHDSGIILIKNLIALYNFKDLNNLNLETIKSILPKPGSAKFIIEKEELKSEAYNDTKIAKLLKLGLDDAAESSIIALMHLNEEHSIDDLQKMVAESVIEANKTLLIPMQLEDNSWSGVVINNDGNGGLQFVYYDSLAKPFRQNDKILTLINSIDITNMSSRIDLCDLVPKSYNNAPGDNYKNTAFTIQNLINITKKSSEFKHKAPYKVVEKVKEYFVEDFLGIEQTQSELLEKYIIGELDPHIIADFIGI